MPQEEPGPVAHPEPASLPELNQHLLLVFQNFDQRYVLSTYYVVGTVLDLAYKSMTKTDKTPAFVEHPGQGRQNELNIWNVGL